VRSALGVFLPQAGNQSICEANRIMEKELTDRAEHIHVRILQLRDSL
jgi:hypothetical protein